jgi:uncharacterized protein (TIGR02117 family)
MLQKVKRWSLRSVVVVLSVLVVYVLLSLILSAIPTGELNAEEPLMKTIYVHSNGVHVDIILPTEEIPTVFLPQLTPGANTKYVGFGWGDKGFYLDTPTWAELKASTALNAMFFRSPTAMHVTDYRSENPAWTTVYVREEQLFLLLKYIRASFATDEEGAVMELPGTGYTDRDRFYEGRGNYSAIMTCNTWVNRAFRQVGIRTAVWTPIDSGILRHVES